MMEQLEGERVHGGDEKLIADGDVQEVWQSVDEIGLGGEGRPCADLDRRRVDLGRGDRLGLSRDCF